MSIIDECAAYFKNTDGFSRLMSGMFDMYVRYERCFGAVRLSNPTPEEEKAISDFFNRDYYNQALIRISLADFERHVQKKFSGSIQLDALLETYTRRPIMRRTSPRITVNAFSAQVESDLLPMYTETEAGFWLREVIAHTRRTYRKWAEAFTREPQRILGILETVCAALNDLPCLRGEKENLMDFTKRHHENAHAFDINNELGSLLLRALARRFDMPLPSGANESSALYYMAGLLTEGVLNSVVVKGIKGFRGDASDKACDFYNKLGETHVLTLEQLSRFTGAQAHEGKIYIIENLPVYSAVNERIRGKICSMMCIGNGLNAAAVCLLDLLSASGTKIYFSGNMDYSGLALADKVYLRHPKLFIPWRYDKTDYEKILSNNEFFLPDHKRDQGLHNDDLASLLSTMRKRGKTAPQMALVEDLANDLMGV
jgi:uncharacterized protein (TIGR02679 family)